MDTIKVETARDWVQVMVEARQQFFKKATGLVYNGPNDFFLREGEEFTPAPYDAERWGKKGPLKECFGNALDLALAFPDELAYVEGVALGDFLGVDHAWCVTEDGTVVDPTWDEPGSSYWGVRIPLALAVETVGRKDTYGVVDNWQEDYPLLREAWMP